MSGDLPDHYVLDDMSTEVTDGDVFAVESDTTNILPDDADADATRDDDDDPPLALGKGAGDAATERKILTRAHISVAILFLINLLNYMDRFTVAGVLDQIKIYYGLSNSQAGALQTAFICSYMVFAPLFGYLGDRYNRKACMTVGIALWSLTTFAGSYVPQGHFYAFLVLRGLVGIGEASYSTIAPTIIADLFTKNKRSQMLMVFYFAIPVGSGLGYIVGTNVASIFHKWQWGLRGLSWYPKLIQRDPHPPCCCMSLREAEAVAEPHHLTNTAGCPPTIAYISCEVTSHCQCMPVRALGGGGWWAVDAASKSSWTNDVGRTAGGVWSPCALVVRSPPLYIGLNAMTHEGHPSLDSEVSIIFGVITCVAGVVGVAAGSQAAQLIKRTNPRADPLVCAFGLLSCSPFLFFALVASKSSGGAAWALIFIGETLLCLNWSVQADIVLYVTVPTRRSTAQAFQILISHLLGDAGSPYLIGVVSDIIARDIGNEDTIYTKFHSLQYALYSTAFIAVLGGGFFLACSLYVVQDRAKVDAILKGDSESSATLEVDACA
ncbi:PREDICTED: protein spinster homolog 1-like, partial [Priapulus caudatus]|uniref:Protein spinster homolog 1-like n=1 Tax=Priapulus caudatus TaxID=37621 RepID=A0ABM1F5R3_PRICU